MYCCAQSQYIGLVVDDKNIPIEGVVITITKQNTPTITENILVSNAKGLFELELKDNTVYLVKTQHLSYKDSLVKFNTNTITPLKIVLTTAENTLNEIVITHQKPKVTIKRDTVSYNILKYIDTNDRKLKDLVEKLPGLTLTEDGSVYFKGEKVSKLLVENQDFFGGSMKLGLDNIPAKAIQKLEILTNYSKSKLLKNNRKTETQVINLILKENKKSIVFGSLEAATNFDGFYKAHGTLFQFLPKKQNNIIIDFNNTAQQALSDDEGYSFSNVDSELFSLPIIPIGNTLDEKTHFKISNKLFTTNLKRFKDKSVWDLIGVYTKLKQKQKQVEEVENLSNNSFEQINSSKSSNTSNIYFRVTNFYQTETTERNFAGAIAIKSNDLSDEIISNSNLGLNTFKKNKLEEEIILGLLLEEVKPLKHNNNLVYGLKLDIDHSSSEFALDGSQGFLLDLIPWVEQNTYTLVNPNRVNKQNLNAAVRYFKPLGLNTTFMASSSLNINLATSKNNQSQQLDNQSLNALPEDFISNANNKNIHFINTLSYRYNNKKLDLKVGSGINTLKVSYKKHDIKENNTKMLLTPFLNMSYSFDNKKQVSLNYIKNIELPSISQLDDFLKVDSHSSVVKGNPNLDNIATHIFSLNYVDFNIPKNYSFKTLQSLTFFDRAFGYIYEFNDINSFSRYSTQDNYGFSFTSRNSFFYLFKTWQIGLQANVRINKEKTMFLSNIDVQNKSIGLSLSSKTNFKNLPNLSISPILKFNKQVFNEQNNNFNSTSYQVKLDYNFTDDIYAFAKYHRTSINGIKAYDDLEFEIRYSNRKNTIDLSLLGINTTSSRFIDQINQSLFFQTTSRTEILKKRVLLKFVYYF